VTPPDSDLLDPRSRHSYHVTDREDLPAVEPWSPAALYRAVRRADDDPDGVVVLDHGRTTLYIAGGTALHYDPPRVLGVAGPPALRVDDPVSYDPEADAVTDGPGRVTVSPAFDVLVPAFGFPDDLDEAPPPLGSRRAGQPTDTGRGTPG
jgi:hypothetical protein